MNAPLRRLTIAAIGLYQRYLSPRKGFRCAYGHHTGRASCSTLGYRAVRRHGVIAGLRLIRRRMYLCGVAHRRYQGSLMVPPRGQRGVVDCDCGGAELPCDASDACSIGDCGGSASNSRKKREREKHVRIPPQTRL